MSTKFVDILYKFYRKILKIILHTACTEMYPWIIPSVSPWGGTTVSGSIRKAEYGFLILLPDPWSPGASESTLKYQAVWSLRNWCCNISHFFPHSCVLKSTNSFFCGKRETFEIETGQKILLRALSCYTGREKELIKEKKVMLYHALYLYGMIFECWKIQSTAVLNNVDFAKLQEYSSSFSNYDDLKILICNYIYIWSLKM